MICTHCLKPTDDGDHFEFGGRVTCLNEKAVRCPRCTAQVAPGAWACGNCGVDLGDL